jgi:hypothetical protein
MRLYSNPHRLLSTRMILRLHAAAGPSTERHQPSIRSTRYVVVTNMYTRISLGFFYPKYDPPKGYILMQVCGCDKVTSSELVLRTFTD